MDPGKDAPPAYFAPSSYGPMPGGQPIPPQPPMTTVVTVIPPFGPDPVHVQCSSCGSMVVTELKPVAGTLSWVLCMTCALFGLFFGCCLIPFCVPSLQDAEHHCPNCKALLGTYRRM
uniref:LITAF domain-containing protein n=1 Tax=Trichuris muris TaxID=70415 RepID=A0A5S6QWG0_TRIMR